MISFDLIERKLRKICKILFVVVIWVTVLALFLFSQQDWDLRASSTHINKIISQGLEFYSIVKEEGGASDYTLGVYILLAVAISPVIILKQVLGVQMCSIINYSHGNCVAESLSLKLTTLILAAIMCWLLKESIEKGGEIVPNNRQGARICKGSWGHGIVLLSFPTVIYCWLL